jgi:hypothetical protein
MGWAKRLLLVALLCEPAVAQDSPWTARLLIDSPSYDRVRAREEVLKRITAGIYDRYTVDLCIDDPAKCMSPAFAPYKTEVDGKTTFTLKMKKDLFSTLPKEVQDAVVREVLYYTWGHPANPASPLDVSVGKASRSPLDDVSPHAREMYLQFGKPGYLVGGLGGDAYGPNCWYNSIAAIADEGSSVAQHRGLVRAKWDKHRFMGQVEFRAHMANFDQVDTPQMGDIVRYFLDDEIYSGDLIFGGEIHAAVYLGRATYHPPDGKAEVRQIVLTKNGRNDHGFLQLLDLARLDELFLPKLPPDSPLIKRYGKDPRRKGYFRVKKGAALLDPATAGSKSASYGGYVIDRVNLKDRWDCLAGKIPPPPGEGTTAYTYPLRWLTVRQAERVAR